MEFAYSGAGKRYKRTEFGGEKGNLMPLLYSDITTVIPLAQETRYVGNVEFIRYGGKSTWISKRYLAGKVLITTVNQQATTKINGVKINGVRSCIVHKPKGVELFNS